MNINNYLFNKTHMDKFILGAMHIGEKKGFQEIQTYTVT